MVAGLQGITDMAKFVPLFLSGGAFSVYQNIEKKNVYAEVKAALLLAFSTNAYVSYDQFQSRKLVPGESVDVFVADLKRLAALVDPVVSDNWIKCALVAGLPQTVRSQLQAASPLDTMTPILYNVRGH